MKTQKETHSYHRSIYYFSYFKFIFNMDIIMISKLYNTDY